MTPPSESARAGLALVGIVAEESGWRSTWLPEIYLESRIGHGHKVHIGVSLESAGNRRPLDRSWYARTFCGRQGYMHSSDIFTVDGERKAVLMKQIPKLDTPWACSVCLKSRSKREQSARAS